jgi:hypothetical protein
VRLCLRPPAVGFTRLSCVWPAGGGCAPPVISKKTYVLPHPVHGGRLAASSHGLPLRFCAAASSSVAAAAFPPHCCITVVVRTLVALCHCLSFPHNSTVLSRFSSNSRANLSVQCCDHFPNIISVPPGLRRLTCGCSPRCVASMPYTRVFSSVAADASLTIPACMHGCGTSGRLSLQGGCR